jgi:mannose-6-phosphate isomerase
MTPAVPSLPLRPLRFGRQFLAKPWGGRELERLLGFDLPAGAIGETWELVDRDREQSVVADGPFQGTRLRDLLQERGREVLGRSRLAPGREFPLLIKFLDARENLSVQVHPHDGLAPTLPPGDAPKTECWYILDATPGGAVYLGLRPGVDEAELRALGGGPGTVERLERHPVRAGDFVFVPAGTVHAIGAGVALAEVQQTSDTTYRLYDWGRTDDQGRPRPLHVDQALRSIRYGERVAGPVRPELVRGPDGAARARLVECPAFAVDLLELDRPLAADTGGLALVYVVLAGEGSVFGSGATPYGVTLRAGDTWLVPASLGGHSLRPKGSLRMLVARAQP